MKYPLVIVAGTFDHIHDGHIAVLDAAFKNGNTVLICLTSDKFIRIYKDPKSNYQSFDDRKISLTEWLGKSGNKNYEIQPLDDLYGPAIEKGDALIVTPHNYLRGEEINLIRAGRGLAPLTLIEVPLVAAKDGKPISSSRIRGGIINQNGKLMMPGVLREALKKPLGTLLSGSSVNESIHLHQNKIIITVGDMATKTVIDTQITPALAIIDHQVERKPYADIDAYLSKFNFKVLVASGPGFINKNAIDVIRHVLAKQTPQNYLIEISGEEDLLALPAILYAPAGTVVYYGQPRAGLVQVEVNEDIRGKVRELLKLFS